MKNMLKRCLEREIIIEYKACLYFCCILFFYFCHLALQGIFSASVPIMCEMVLTAYLVGYLQVYIFRNFDEAKRIEAVEAVGFILCTGVYMAASWFFSWFGREKWATVLFLLYLLLVYICIYVINRIKQSWDTEMLNQMLGNYKAVSEVERAVKADKESTEQDRTAKCANGDGGDGEEG